MSILKRVAKNALQVTARVVAFIAESSDDTVLGVRPHLQIDGYSCGLQSLASILDYYKFDVDLNELASDIGLTDDGCDEDQIRKAIRAYDLRHRTLRNVSIGKIQECIDRGHPVLVPINNDGHWAVVYGYGDEKVYLMDPKPSKAFSDAGRITLEEFLSVWDGYGIEVMEQAEKRSRGGARSTSCAPAKKAPVRAAKKKLK